MKRLTLTLAAATLALAATTAAADLESMMENCNGCHGPGGVSENTDVPTIAGFPEFVHVDALYVYQDEARPCAESEYLSRVTRKHRSFYIQQFATTAKGNFWNPVDGQQHFLAVSEHTGQVA